MTSEFSWIQSFEQFFQQVELSFAKVLPAASCREGWLQGEFYRYFFDRVNHFSVNTFSIGPKQKADLHSNSHTPMVAELKVYGLCRYQNKNINGYGSINQFLPEHEGHRVDITVNHLGQVNPKGGSILKDITRLQSIADDYEKYMVLVIHKNGMADKFGRAIQAIRINTNEYTFEFNEFLVRIWIV